MKREWVPSWSEKTSVARPDASRHTQARMPIVHSSCAGTVAYLSSLREITVLRSPPSTAQRRRSEEDEDDASRPIVFPVGLEPSFVLFKGSVPNSRYRFPNHSYVRCFESGVRLVSGLCGERRAFSSRADVDRARVRFFTIDRPKWGLENVYRRYIRVTDERNRGSQVAVGRAHVSHTHTRQRRLLESRYIYE